MFVLVVSLHLLVLCVPLLAQEPCTITVMPGESIQAAIDAASPDDVICLAGGEWKEHIMIEKSLTLGGAGAEKTTLQGVEDDLPVVAIYGSDEAETRVALSGIHVGRNADGAGQGLVVGELIRGGAQVTIEACTVTGHTTGILLQHQSTVTMTICTVSENSFDGIGVGGNVYVTITDSTVTGNKYGLRFWASPQATISHSTVSGSRLDSIVIGHSAQVSMSDSTISGGRSGILISGSAEVTIVESMIEDRGGYGVALIEPPCFDTGDLFTGYVTGRGNTGGEDAGGNVCPDDLAFLFTHEGGGLDRRDTVTVQPGESTQAAIDAAPDGATVYLAAGEWHENITITKSLTLRGSGIDATVIKGLAGGLRVIRVESTEEIEVVIAWLTAAEAKLAEPRNWREDGIHVGGQARVAIASCAVVESGWNGISVGDSAQATILNSIVRGSGGTGGVYVVDSAQAALIGSMIERSGWNGVLRSKLGPSYDHRAVC